MYSDFANIDIPAYGIDIYQMYFTSNPNALKIYF